jgi:hypothetical protein
MTTRALDTNGERNLVLDYLLGYPMHHLASTYGVTRQTAYRIFARHGIKPDRKP